MSVPKNKRGESSTMVLNELKNICGLVGQLLNSDLLINEIKEEDIANNRPMRMLHVSNKQIAQRLDIVTKHFLIDIDIDDNKYIEFKQDDYALQRKELRENIIDEINNLLLTIKSSALYNRCEPIDKPKINNVVNLIKNLRTKIEEENVQLMEVINRQQKQNKNKKIILKKIKFLKKC